MEGFESETLALRRRLHSFNEGSIKFPISEVSLFHINEARVGPVNYVIPFAKLPHTRQYGDVVVVALQSVNVFG